MTGDVLAGDVLTRVTVRAAIGVDAQITLAPYTPIVIKKSSFLTSLTLASCSLLAACGGGGDNAREVLSGSGDTSNVTTDTASSTTETPEATEPPVTQAPEPTDVPGSTDVPVATDASAGAVGDLAAFCGASEQFYVEARALDSIDGDADSAARTLFAGMSVSVSGAIFNAPTAEVAAVPQRAQELLAVFVPALEAVDYDADAVNDLGNAGELNAAFDEFGQILDQLETFVVAECGSDVAELQSASVAKADEVSGASDSTDVATTIDEPASDDVAVDVIVADDSETISVSVPSSWTDVNGAPDGDLRQVVAAPDAAAFLAGFNAPGVIIVAGDVPAGNGAAAGIAGLDGLSASVEADGCVLGQSIDYDDGVYVGTERTYSCPGTDAVARFAGGTNADASIFWLLGAVYAPTDVAVWNLITESFLVD